MSRETTFLEDLWDKRLLLAHLAYLCDRLTLALREDRLYAHVIEVKARYADFKTEIKRRLVLSPLQETGKIYKIAEELFLELFTGSRLALRLVGVKASELVRVRPLALFEPYSERPEVNGMFVPLRIHSVYSRGRGSVTLEEASGWAAARRLPAAGLADIGNIYGWGKWKRVAPAGGYRPLFGCELEVGGRRFVFLVKTRAGYSNLMEIFNRREIRDMSGLVVIYVPGGGASAAEAKEGDASPPDPGADVWPNEAAMLADLREKVAPGDLYSGAEFGNFSRLQESDLPVVWANPVKYLASPERLVLLRAIEKKVPYPPERDRLLTKVRVFGPDQEALALRRFGDAAKDALARTAEVAEKCEFAFDGIVPNLPADLFPRGLREVVQERLAAAKSLTWKERQRARRELAAVEQSGFGPYFLVVHDIVEFARRRGILHNLRGSGASSFLGWLLGLSHVNPIEFDLYFERFLNRGRPDPPDIDIDFDSRRRDEVLRYVLERYGAGKTGAAYVCELKDFGGRSALYETLRAFGLPPDEARGQSKRVPYFAEPSWLRQAAPAPGRLDAWKLAAELQDVFREISLHVGGVILTPGPVESYLPLETSAKGLRMTHFDKDAVEDLRLIKLDLLSVRGLAAISETKEKLKLRTLPAGDAATYAALRTARTVGCFQVGRRLRDHPGPGPGPSGADRERHEGGAFTAEERPSRRGRRPGGCLPGPHPARDRRHPPLRGTGHAGGRAGGRHPPGGGRPPAAQSAQGEGR
ncbi:MAG: polymerase-3 subunit alpha [Candidatus Aminicenantes bacterium]|nr:polymerase-3 subunit alpha [Candidatus Aminicenantes bacterium]